MKSNRSTEEIRQYNEAAKKVILNMGGKINDLFGKMIDKDSSWYKDYCHYTDEGFKYLADNVAKCILDNIE